MYLSVIELKFDLPLRCIPKLPHLGLLLLPFLPKPLNLYVDQDDESANLHPDLLLLSGDPLVSTMLKPFTFDLVLWRGEKRDW